MAAHIAKQGRKPVGWEEIMHGGNITRLAKASLIMPWLDVNNGVKSANAGFGVVHPTSEHSIPIPIRCRKRDNPPPSIRVR